MCGRACARGDGGGGGRRRECLGVGVGLVGGVGKGGVDVTPPPLNFSQASALNFSQASAPVAPATATGYPPPTPPLPNPTDPPHPPPHTRARVWGAGGDEGGAIGMQESGGVGALGGRVAEGAGGGWI